MLLPQMVASGHCRQLRGRRRQWQWQLLKCSSAVVALAILNGNYVVRFGSKTFCVVATLTKESAGNPAEDSGPATGQQLLTVARNVCWLR